MRNGNDNQSENYNQTDLEIENEKLRRTIEKIQEFQNSYEELYDFAPVGYVTIDEQGIILDSNHTFAHLIRIPEDSLTNGTLADFILAKDQPNYDLFQKKLFETGTETVTELRIKTGAHVSFWVSMKGKISRHKKSGTSVARIMVIDIDKYKQTEEELKYLNTKTGKCYECHDSAIKWIDGRLFRMELAIDITDRKKAEQALKGSEEKHRRLFETMSQGVIYQDAAGAIISENPAAERILGLSLDQMLGKTSMAPRWKMIREDGSLVPGTRHPAMQALQTGQKVGPVTRGVFHSDKNAHTWLSITAIPLFQAGETTPFQVYATIEDITGQKQAEEKIKHLNEVLLAIRNVNQLITQEKDQNQLLHKCCQNLVETRGYHNAWIGLLDGQNNLSGFYSAGLEDKALILKEHLEKKLTLNCLETILEGKNILVIDDPSSQCTNCPLKTRYKFRAGLSGRLEYQGRFFGIICVSTPGKTAHDKEELELFEELVGDISFALHSLEREEERKEHRENLRMYELIISTVKDPMSIVDRNYVYRTVNEAYLNTFLKDSKDEIVGHTVENLLGSKVFHGVVKPRLDRSFNGEEVHYEEWFETPFGEKVCRAMHYYPYWDQKGEIRSVVVNARDITEQKRMETAIKESHHRVLTVLNNINSIVYVVDMETYDILFANQYVRDNFGVVEGEKCWKTIHSEQTGPCDFCTNEKLVDAEGKPTGVYRWEFKNTKSGKWYDCHDSAITWDDGRLVRMEIAIDITQRKRAEDKIRESEQRFQKMLNIVPDMISIHSPEMDILYSNWQGFGAVPEDKRIQNTKCYKTYRGFDDVCSDCRAKSVLDSKKPIEEDVVLSNGTCLELHVIPLLDENNNVEMFMEWVRDITDRKQAEEETEKLQAQLMQAQKMESVGRLAGGVAHDINNKILIILGYAELIQESLEKSDPNHDFIEEIINAGQKSTNIISQLLAFARKQIIRPRVCDLNEIVETMLKMIRRLIGEDIELVWMPGANTWPVKIDPAQIDQILANLCVNARDAITGIGKITIETEDVTIDEEYCSINVGFLPGEYAMLVVSDNGDGMDNETLDYIFEPFFTTKPVGVGTGLGLATVYGIVKQNKGFINVYSEPGKGTSFKIYLPSHIVDTREFKTKSDDTIPMGDGKTVLLVEDEKPIMKMSKLLLEKLDYFVLTADTPSEALHLAEQHSGNIDLLITDVIMPEMNGRLLADQLNNLYPNIKMLFMSGYTANVIAHHGVLDKGVHFIQKPFSKKELAVKIKMALEQS